MKRSMPFVVAAAGMIALFLLERRSWKPWADRVDLAFLFIAAAILVRRNIGSGQYRL
jgi:uncharacterized membrane protein YoaK (UPF0700 family)